jgi:hypothetical protein
MKSKFNGVNGRNALEGLIGAFDTLNAATRATARAQARNAA